MAAITPESRPIGALASNADGASESESGAEKSRANRMSVTTLTSREIMVVAKVPSRREANVAVVSAEPQQMATAIARKIPVRSTTFPFSPVASTRSFRRDGGRWHIQGGAALEEAVGAQHEPGVGNGH